MGFYKPNLYVVIVHYVKFVTTLLYCMHMCLLA